MSITNGLMVVYVTDSNMDSVRASIGKVVQGDAKHEYLVGHCVDKHYDSVADMIADESVQLVQNVDVSKLHPDTGYFEFSLKGPVMPKSDYQVL